MLTIHDPGSRICTPVRPGPLGIQLAKDVKFTKGGTIFGRLQKIKVTLEHISQTTRPKIWRHVQPVSSQPLCPPLVIKALWDVGCSRGNDKAVYITGHSLGNDVYIYILCAFLPHPSSKKLPNAYITLNKTHLHTSAGMYATLLFVFLGPRNPQVPQSRTLRCSRWLSRAGTSSKHTRLRHREWAIRSGAKLGNT